MPQGLGGLARGFRSGFSLALQSKALKQQEARQKTVDTQKLVSDAQTRIETLRKDLALGIKSIGDTDPTMTSEQAGVQRGQLINQYRQIAGAFARGDVPSLSPGTIDERFNLFQNSPTGVDIRATEAAQAGAIKKSEGQAQIETAKAKVKEVGGTPEERQHNFAQLIGIGKEKTTPFLTLLDALKDAAPGSTEHKFIVDRINKLSQEEMGTSFEIGEDGSIRVTMGKVKPVTSGKADEIRAQQSANQTGLDIVKAARSALKTDSSRFGVVGSARKFSENVGGILKDLAGSSLTVLGLDAQGAFEQLNQAIDVEEADDGVKNSLRPTSAGELDVYRSRLQYAVARSLQPQGRLLKDAVDQARSITDFTGFKSSQMIDDRLSAIERILESSQTDIQRRLEQGMTGETQTERLPAAEPKKSASNNESLIDKVNKILSK